MNGNPLTEEQTAAVLEAANNGDFVDRLLTVLFHTGLTATEFTHMHDDWLEPLPDSLDAYNGDTPIIRIPEQADCRRIKLGQDLQIAQRTGRCGYCKDSEYETWYPGWPDDDCRVRTIPVPNEDTVETLYWWFSRYDSTPISVNSLEQRLSRLANRAGLERDITARDVRATYGANLVRMGFDSEQIAEMMRLSHHTYTRDFFDAAERDVDWPAWASVPTILCAIAEHEPVIKSEIGELAGYSRATGVRHSNDLIEQGVLVKVGERHEGHSHANLYSIDPETLIDEGFYGVAEQYYSGEV